MPRILIVNPNTTQAVTATVLTEARRCARPGTDLVAVTAATGVTIVSTEAENVIAAQAALDLLAMHHAGCDAAIVAMSFDTGVGAARSLLPLPVIGITEAALHTACLLGRRFGLLLLGAVSRPLYEDLLQRTGLATRLGAIEVVEVASAAAYLDRTAVDAAIRGGAQALAAKAQSDIVVVCGAAIAGVAHRLQADLPIRIIDGVAPAVAQAELLAGLGLPAPRPPRRLAAGDPPTGLIPALARLFDG